jgi:phosphomannomutase
MTQIKFGTDGWRAIIAEDYTTHNVARVTKAVAIWLKTKIENPVVVVGHDCRFGGKMFAETTVKVLVANGVKVLFADNGFVSTPMVSLGVLNYKADLGVVITASHNPPSYNGYKLKGSFGGPLLPADVADVETLIPDSVDNSHLSIELSNELVSSVDLEGDYINHCRDNFDIDLIASSKLNFAYDAMYGAGKAAVRKLFPDMEILHEHDNPGFKGQAPEPILKNLLPFSQFIKKEGNIASGLATDGDADRIGLFDSSGNFVDSHHVILLLIHYLVKYKGYNGKVVTAFSCTPKIAKMCEHYGLEHETVKIGFKYVAGIMVNEDVLLGGEESGGIATKGHIPERDGIWMGLIIWEFMAKTGRSIEDLISEVYSIVGEFAFERNDLHITDELKNETIEKCKNQEFKSFGKYNIIRTETIDGFKYFFDEERWLMIRPSGTEPVLRTYVQAPTIEEVRDILNICENIICAKVLS